MKKSAKDSLKKYFWVFLIMLAMVVAPMAARADVTYVLDTLLSGSLPPSGSPPWVQAVFHDVSPGTVDLTMQVLDLNNREHVGHWYFNVADPHAGNLTFALTSALPLPYVTDPNTQGQGLNGFPVPVGTFDIDIFFHNEFLGAVNTGPPLDASGLNGHSPEITSALMTYRITSSVAGLQASSFGILDSTGKQFTTALIEDIAEIGKTGTVASYVGTVPEPSTMLLLGSGLVGLAGFARRRFRK